ncbi:MAG: DotA/TraY family protein [Micavibrio sp.]
MNITKGDVLRYMLTPQIGLRLRGFYDEGFGRLAFMIASVYRAVGILPANHPVLNPANRQGLGLRTVLGAAAAEISFTRENYGKVVIYFLILLGLVLLTLQFFLTMAYLMVNPALASSPPTSYSGFFAAPEYTTDVAYRMLFTVFGVPEIFRPGALPSEFHAALHSLFQFYSIGILVIAVIIVCYYIFAVLAETAETGVPFGKRYNHVWAPIRLVFGLGLLIPVGYGLNSAQWITLYTAKYASDFATQGWIKFNEVMTDSFIEDTEQRVGTPMAQDLMPLVAFMSVVNACEYSYRSQYKDENVIDIDAYLIKDASQELAGKKLGGNFKEAHEYFNKGNIYIRFGEWKPERHTQQLGNVYPYCGDIIINSADVAEPGSIEVQEYYYKLIRDLYLGNKFQLITVSGKMAESRIPGTQSDYGGPEGTFKAGIATELDKEVAEVIKKAVKTQAGSKTWDQDSGQIRELGWGGAGIWYNKIAQVNGSLVDAVYNTPQVVKMPAVMEHIRAKQLQENMAVGALYMPSVAGDNPITFDTAFDQEIGRALAYVYDYWASGDLRQDGSGAKTRSSNNILIDTINLIFGTRGLFDMCASTDVHPLAQLSTLGKGLIESSIRNIGLSIAFSFGGVIPFVGPALSAASSILMTVASITISMGFLLFYVLPFMPFLYFFFAVGGWIKGLFEAMIGLPLWALSFLKIDGEGLPGDAAMNGIHLILEIFIRPILIIFGLLASVIIFAAIVKVLNEIFTLVVVNLAGHDPNATSICGKSLGDGSNSGNSGNSGFATISYIRGPIDELFFTVMYAIIVYMIGTSCFKLIDLIPNNMLRYMGANVNSFNDKANDPWEGMMLNLSVSASMVSNQVLGGSGSVVGGAAGTVSNSFKEFASRAMKE